MVGTMNNAGTVLLTVADMSVIEAEVEVDETDIPFVQLGQLGEDHDRRAFPTRRSRGKVTEIGNSPIQAAGAGTDAHGDELQGHGHDRRPDSRSAAGLHLHGGDHDGDAQAGRVGADPGDDRARAALRRARATSSTSRGRRARVSASARRRRPGRRRRDGAQARPEARRSRRRLPDAATARPSSSPSRRASPARRYLEVLDGPQGRRPGDHRPVRVGARHVRRRRS